MAPWSTIVTGMVAGALAGSYLATVALRWPRGKGASTGRSRCDACNRPLPPSSLVPVVSWLVQRGRCRFCGAPIAPEHLLLELGGMGIGGVSFALLGADWPQALAAALLGWILLTLAILDLRHFWLPDRLTYPLAALGLAANLVELGPGWLQSLAGMAAGYGSLWAVALAYRTVRGREGLGGGDPKLFGAIGAWVGVSPLPLVLVLASGAGLVAATISAIRKQHWDGGLKLPLGTLLCSAAWPVWLVVAVGLKPL